LGSCAEVNLCSLNKALHRKQQNSCQHLCCCLLHLLPAALLLLQLLSHAPADVPARVNSWVGVFVVLLAIIMNEGAVDSLQNGLAASISSHFLKNLPLKWTR
jgi:hypothetical protein